MGPGISQEEHSFQFPLSFHPTHVLLLTGTCTHAFTLWTKNFVFFQNDQTQESLPICSITSALNYNCRFVLLGLNPSSAITTCVVLPEML